MRIGLLTTSYPRHPGDPAGGFVAGLARWLADAEHRLEVLAPAPAADDHPGVQVRGLRYALRPRLLYGAGAPENLGRHPRAWLQAPAFSARLAVACWRRAHAWQALISHWLLPCGVAGALAAPSLPHLALAHGSDAHLLGRLPGAPALLHALARPRTALVLTSEALRQPLARSARSARARRLVGQARVARMGIPARPLSVPGDAGARLRRRHGLDQSLVVLFLGRLVPVKGADLLLRACAGLPGTALVLAGDGPQRPDLERLARRLDPGARFLGQQTGPDKEAWLAAADLLVLPSRVLPDGRGDSAPVVLLEAMAAGLPVVATDVGGNADLIRQRENGLLVPPEQPRALRRAIADLRDDPGLRRRLGQAGQHTAAGFTWDRVGAELLGLLASL